MELWRLDVVHGIVLAATPSLIIRSRLKALPCN
jgi:hypothetical protein